MRCPNCRKPGYQFPEPCPNCQFQPDDTSEIAGELSHINWLLAEIDTWKMLSRMSRERVQQQYVKRQKDLEIELGLRLPPYTKEEAREIWPELIKNEFLLQQLAEWLETGQLNPVSTQPLVDQISRQVDDYLEQLDGHRRPTFSQTNREHLNLINFLLETVEYLRQNNGFASIEAEEQLLTPLVAEQEQLEIKLGLRPEPTPEPVVEQTPIESGPEDELVNLTPEDGPVEEKEPVERVEPEIDTQPLPELPPAPPPKPGPPPIPFRDRLWQTLLSERTLQAMLFLGIFLLFSAALSFVAWGWKDFSAPVRVTVPTGFTVLFFAMGWYVRTKTPMYRSGIALSAIAALLIPIDFYTIYVNFNIPPNFWSYFWLTTSLTCLVAYILTTLVIRSQFFGYLVGVAAGSTVLALIEVGHQLFGMSLDWRSTGLSGLALGLIMLATTLSPSVQKGKPQSALSIFADPFRYLSLLTIGVILPLTFGWRFIRRDTYDTLHYAVTVNWWLGGFIFGWGAIQYRSRGLGILAAITLPVATYLAQAAIFDQTGINPAWHAFGWALLVPLYFIAGYKLLTFKEDPVIYGHGRTAIRWGVMLLVIAAFWSLTDPTNGAAAAASHTVLAGAVILATLLWHKPRYLYGASMLSFSATSFAMAEMDLTLAQLSVGWASLAIVHLVMAVNVGTRFPIPAPNLAAPLVTAGYLIAGVALLPTLIPYDENYLAYALGNWLLLAGWGARLAHIKQPGFVGRGVWRKPIFHWFTTVPLPIWLWILLTNLRLPDFVLPLALVALAWAMILLSYRLAKTSATYRYPWALTGGLVSLIAPVAAFAVAPSGFTPGVTLLAVGLLYFVDAIINRQSGELVPAGLVTAWGYVFILNRSQLPTGAVSFGLALLIAVYFIIGLWTERKKPANYSRRFLSPLYLTGHFLTFLLLIQFYLPVLNNFLINTPWTDETRLWAATGQLLLALIYGLYAWSTYKERWAHLATWLTALGCAFVAITYSTANGSIVAELGCIAIAFVLAERGLHWLYRSRIGSNRQQAFLRLTWRLFKRPLLITGWTTSAVVIGLSLLSSLPWFGSSRAMQIWATGALLLITALYAVSARLFRQARFVWLAVLLSIAPWTILANLGWLTPYAPSAATYALSWAILAWVLFFSNLVLKRLKTPAYALAPKTVARALLLFSLGWSIINFTPGSILQALALLGIGLLYFVDAALNRQSLALAPGAFVTGWGYLVLLDWLYVPFDTLGFALALAIAIYILAGLRIERKKYTRFTHQFLAPLYLTTHVLTLGVLWQIYVRPFDSLFFGVDWTDAMLLWGAASQLVLGLVYGFYAWRTYKERWAHFATWLVAFGGGFVAITFSTGGGSSAAKAALGAIAFILIERGLYRLGRGQVNKTHWSFGWIQDKRDFFRLTWQLYRRPLLVTGWVVSAGVIGLALIRNLLILEGGRTQQFWAAMALLLITGLYALSARLFRQARFIWLAAPLIFAPWTIITHLGWFTPYRPTLPGYALSWMVLAWVLMLVSLIVHQRASWPYALPLRLVAHLLVPFSLLWGIADVDTSRFTFGLAVAFYGLGSMLRHRHLRDNPDRALSPWQTTFFYPALGLVPIWSTYLLAWLAPAALREHYGFTFLMFGAVGLAVGQGLYRLAPKATARNRYALPAYITGYVSLAVGTALAAYEPSLLALALFFDALLMLISAWLFKKPVWVYLATLLIPLSLLAGLYEFGVPVNRYGWGLIGLASIYLIAAYALRRANLATYGTAPLTTGFLLVASALPPSSMDQTGAFWGYGAAALIYAISAFWLRQPLLLTPASVLTIVPYAVALQISPLMPEYYGLALIPAAGVALMIGWGLDRHFGPWINFPWGRRDQWFSAAIDRLTNWWALPLYGVGFGLAVASSFFVQFEAGLMAWSFLLMMPVFGWATYRFRLRGWLVALVGAGHFAAIFYLGELGWWSQPNLAEAWLRFLPVTLFMTSVTLFIERYRHETSLLDPKGKFDGWSHPLYIMLFIDITISQILSMSGSGTTAAAIVTLTHTVIIAMIASFWLSSKMSYLSIGMGVLTIILWAATLKGPIEGLPVLLAQLAFVYGLVGYGLALIRNSIDDDRVLRPWLAIWELPLQRSSLGLSFGTLAFTALLGIDLMGWSIQAILGFPFRAAVDITTVQMVVWVLGFLGLLYVLVSFTHRWLRFGYIAIGMLLTAWMLHVFYIQQWDDLRRLQWYTIPVGLYLLGIAYMEWQQGHKTLGRRLDYLAMVLMLGSLFWQTLLFGWGYALLLGTEGLAAFYWGSARRLRRFLYAGMVGVILATLGQLLNSLRSINQWIVFGIIGLLLVMVAIVVERKLEDIKSWKEILESWE